MKNIPKKIYLQVGDEVDVKEKNDFKELGEVSWCSDKIHQNDIEYIRAPSKRLPEMEELIDKYIQESGYGMDMWSNQENDAITRITDILYGKQKA